jgi:hypothetical protein
MSLYDSYKIRNGKVKSHLLPDDTPSGPTLYTLQDGFRFLLRKSQLMEINNTNLTDALVQVLRVSKSEVSPHLKDGKFVFSQALEQVAC